MSTGLAAVLPLVLLFAASDVASKVMILPAVAKATFTIQHKAPMLTKEYYPLTVSGETAAAGC